MYTVQAGPGPAAALARTELELGLTSNSCGDSWQLAAANALSTKLSSGTRGRALEDWFNDFMISST